MNNEKKLFLVQNRFWATAQIIYEKKNCIAMQGSALQEVSGLRGFCVVIQ